MDGNSEQLQVINLKQLPIIEERLRDVKAKIEQRTSAVMALAVTEETRTDVKKIRTEVRKELEGYEAQRMAVKKAIMTPYEQFEAVYKECVSNPYKAADEALGKKIADVEVGIKQQKEDDVRAFFTELTSGFGLDWLKFEQMNLKVTLTCTRRSKPWQRWCGALMTTRKSSCGCLTACAENIADGKSGRILFS